MDESLIKLVNKLQDAFATVGVHNPVDLPQMVVIGSQSSGKSSVLENIVGRDFLPRGSGIVTRRPLILQLINNKLEKQVAEEKKEVGEWGEFLHKPKTLFSDFEDIRTEILRETEAKLGNNAGISAQPINLRIFSPRVLTLTLVDLPGLTKVPVGDQPKDIEKQIRDMVLKYIIKPNAIILAVTAANTDLANSDGLKLAREVDPDGTRTIGVLTKIDLMDHGTNVVEILAGRVIPLKLGYVPVVNRGQRDIENRTSIDEALKNERIFFENHPAYQSKAQYCGTPFLTRKLNMILLHHIRNTLPDIKAKIQSTLVKYKVELSQLGDPVGENSTNQANLILSMINEFCNDYRAVIEGNANDLSSYELSGGARISFVFHELFGNSVKSIDPFDQVKDVDIRTILYNSSGSSPALFVATAAFEVIIKQQIRRLEEPSLKCVSLVYDELVRILNQLLQKAFFKRFPGMRDQFYSVVVAFLRRAMGPTSVLVQDVISMESCYINTAHPDFLNGHKAMAIVNERMMENARGYQGTPVSASPSTPADGKNIPRMSNSPMMANLTSPVSNAGLDGGGNSSTPGFFGSFFPGKKKKPSTVLEPPPAVLKATGTLSEREQVETEVIKLLIQSYFNIVKRTIVDMVPKAVMLKLVTQSKEELQRELLQEIYRSQTYDTLLVESEFTRERRNECAKMIEALNKAEEIVSTV